MKTTRIYILIMLMAGMISSCIKEIEFNGDTVDPLVVVNSFVSPDSIITAHLTKSKFFLSSKNDFDYINNAVVEVYVNSTFKENLQFRQQGFYQGTYRPKSGDTIRLAVQVPNMHFVESTIIMPESTIILSVDTTMILRDMYEMYLDKDQTTKVYYYDCDFHLKLRDDGDKKNYYRFVVKKSQEIIAFGDTTYQEYFLYFELQGIDSQQGGNLTNLFEDGGYYSDQHLFSDDLFNGKEFTLRFKDYFSIVEIPPGYEDAVANQYLERETLYINLQSISREMYLYLQSKRAAENSLGNFFSEPVQIYNNITNGIGIFGGYTNNIFEYRLY